MGYTQIGDETGVKLGLKRGCDFRDNSTNWVQSFGCAISFTCSSLEMDSIPFVLQQKLQIVHFMHLLLFKKLLNIQ
jgi:hypothetical protein